MTDGNCIFPASLSNLEYEIDTSQLLTAVEYDGKLLWISVVDIKFVPVLSYTCV
jgi:hypothetical protein